MSDKKISQLTPGSTLVGTEPIPMVQGGQTVATTPNAISALIKPYKVYTALLTQSGGDVPSTGYGDENINSGVTYTITANPDNYDLTIYGAPNSNAGTSFIANQSANLPYTYSLTFSYNTGAPIATVLENTIGNIWFTYNAIGNYNVNSIGLFTQNKTVVFIQNTTDDSNNSSTNLGYGGTPPDNIQIITATQSGGLWSNNDGILYNTPIEIRVYN